MTDPLALLDEPAVRAALIDAWRDSKPGTPDAHEEGGFVLRTDSGEFVVSRWPPGDQAAIAVPEHEGCRFHGMRVFATFHTHPNAGEDYDQRPSRADIRAIRSDRNLRADYYLGEFVISQDLLYFIEPGGAWRVVDTSATIINRAERE